MNSKPSSPKKIKQLLATLPAKAQRGSKPRCHLLTHGTRVQVAARLTALMGAWGSVAPTDSWLPEGFEDHNEAELPLAPELLTPVVRVGLARWWLPNDHLADRTPNWDIASSCTIDGRRGLLLVEAKAHENELVNTISGRKLDTRNQGDQATRDASHHQIGVAIEQARAGLQAASSLPWEIRIDSHYQLASRFAWAWKVAQLGVPVVMVYLGFIGADEMKDRGAPLASAAEWDAMVRAHAKGLVPGEVWGSQVDVGGAPLVPLIVSVAQEL